MADRPRQTTRVIAGDLLPFAFLWAGCFFALGIAVYLLETRVGTSRSVVVGSFLGTAWLAGIPFLASPTPKHLVVCRTSAAYIATWSLALAGGSRWWELCVAAIPASSAWLFSFSPSLRWHTAARAARKGELRIPLAVPTGLLVTAVLPALVLIALALGSPLLLVAKAISMPTAVGLAVFGTLLAWPYSASSMRMEERWLVIAPRGLVLHDPFLLSAPLRIPQDSVSHVSRATAGFIRNLDPQSVARLCDARAGVVTRILLVHLERPLEAPQPRHRRISAVFPPAGKVATIALAVSDVRRAFFELARAGYAKSGEYARLELDIAARS